MKSKLFTIFFIVSMVSIMGYASWQIISTLQERYISKQEYESVRESYVSAIKPKEERTSNTDTQDTDQEEAPSDDGFPNMTIDLAGLYKKNNDFVAWIYYEDGGVNYPIVQEKKSELNKYLDTTFEGTKNPSGCTFISYDSDPVFRFMNTFVYGHNMANGSMFGTLKKIYQDPSKYLNPYFYIWTNDNRILKYRIFAMYVVQNTDKMFSIPLTNESYSQYVNDAMNLGTFNQYVPFTKHERNALANYQPIVSLSTCYGPAGTSKRLLFQGVLIDQKEVKN